MALTNLAGLLLETGRLDEAERHRSMRLTRAIPWASVRAGHSHAALALAAAIDAAARRSLQIAVDCDPLLEAPRQALARLTRSTQPASIGG